MRIRYDGRRGLSPLVLNGVQGDSAEWTIGQEREYGPDDELMRRTPGATYAVNAIEYILSVGPEFVDAAIGKNPFFLCADCGKQTTSLTFTDVETLQTIPYRDENGKLLCITDYLAKNPQWLDQHRRTVFDASIIREAEKRAAQFEKPAPSAPAAAVRSTIAPPNQSSAAPSEGNG